MTKKHTFQDLAIGTRIYYTGDMANQSGFGTISAHREANKWHSGGVDVTMDDGREMKCLMLCMFDPSIGRRFLTLAEYEANKAAQIAEYKAELIKRGLIVEEVV